jgi:apolipoprotein D and lipocalin family protein
MSPEDADMRFSLALLGLMAVASTRTAPVQSVATLDLKRYLGTWHEIARLPMFFQRHCDRNVTAHYSANSDGTIRIHNACIREDGSTIAADGLARPGPGRKPAELQVRFAPGWLGWLPFAWADYWVIALDEQHYRWAMVGEPRRKFLWILSRDPSIDRGTFENLKARAMDMGYRLAPLIVSGEIH